MQSHENLTYSDKNIITDNRFFGMKKLPFGGKSNFGVEMVGMPEGATNLSSGRTKIQCTYGR
jgi:hypothetical protein